MKRLICLIFLLAMLLPCMGQESDPELIRLRRLHLECEKAFKVNDYATMGEKLKESRRLLDSLDAAGKHGLEYYEGAYFKDKGNFHYSMQDMDEDQFFDTWYSFLEALEYFQYAESEPDIIKTMYDLAQLYYKEKDYESALEYMRYIVNRIQTKDQVRPYLRPYALCLARCGSFDQAENTVRIAEKIKPRSYELPADDKFETTRVRAKIAALKAEAQDGDMKKAAGLYKEYFHHKRDSIISNFDRMSYIQRESFWLRMHPFMTDCYRTESADPGFLYNVALFSKSILLQYSDRKSTSITLTWQDLYKKLEKGECAIEFISYERNNKQMIGALVLKKSSGNMKKEAPVFIRIAETDSILNFRLADGSLVESALSKDNNNLKNLLYDNEDLRQMIWTPELALQLTGCNDVYFSPDNIFHQMAIEYMLPPVLESTAFHRLTSTRELFSKRKPLDISSVLLCGGVDYFHSSINDSTFNNDVAAYNMLYDMNAFFKKLPGAMQEVHTIYQNRDNPSDSLTASHSLNESNIEELFNRYPIVHISTHGYFGSTQGRGSDLQVCTSDDVLSKSVMILSGAQTNLDNPAFNPAHADGILSAKELSHMDLSNVQLFIASACQTGLGKISGDGVYGMQRGLKNAGVQAIIVSLWSVGDDATCYLMVKLYEGLDKGMDLQQAFDYARQCMNEDQETEVYRFNTAKLRGSSRDSMGPAFSKPQFRNAFILIDNI